MFDIAQRAQVIRRISVGTVAFATFLLVTYGCEQFARIGGSFNADGGIDGAPADADLDVDEDDGGDLDVEVAHDAERDADFDLQGCWVSVPSPFVSNFHQVVDVSFIDQQRGWLVIQSNEVGRMGGAHYTENAGATWEHRVQLASNRQIGLSWFDDGRFLWMWTDHTVGFQVFTSHDNGEHFEPCPESVSLQRLHFFDEGRAFAVGYTMQTFCNTSDGCSTWECGSQSGTFPFNGLESFDSSLWLVGGFDDSRVSADILISDNGGETWQRKSLVNEIEVGMNGPLYEAHALSTLDVWAVGTNRQMFHTTDGWNTHQQIHDLPHEIVELRDVEFRDSHGIAVATTVDNGIAMVETIDSGETWQITHHEQDICSAQCTIAGVSYPSRGPAYVFEKGGRLWRCERGL